MFVNDNISIPMSQQQSIFKLSCRQVVKGWVGGGSLNHLIVPENTLIYLRCVYRTVRLRLRN